MFIQAEKALLLNEFTTRINEQSLSAMSIFNLIYKIKSQYFSMIFEALNSTQSALQLCFSKYVQ